MKLQSKYNRATIAATIFVLFAGSIGYYFLLQYTLLKPVDEALRVEEQEIIHYINQNNRLPAESHFQDQIIQFVEAPVAVERHFVNKDVHNPFEKEMEISRQLIFPVELNGKKYTAIVTKSQVEAHELLILILSMTSIIILLLFAILFFANRTLLKKLWRPFYSTLAQMKEFNLSNPGELVLEKTGIDEFNSLNMALNEMTQKIRQDYTSLKAFAENASHEMQTPLAVINSKLDLLIQDPNLNEKNMQKLQGIYNAVSKLTNLNQSLLLLTKIENNQFTELKSIQLDALIKEKLLQFDELMQARNLSVNTELQQCKVLINPALADILVTNLLSNALKHNISGGRINISTTAAGLSIANSSILAALDPNLVYNRFEKSAESDGIGLGLAIIKQICELYKFAVNYSYKNGIHHFNLSF